MNDQKKFALSVHEKEHFSSSVFLNVTEGLKSQLLLDDESESESEKEREMIVSEIEEIREMLKLSGGSMSDYCSSFSKMKSTGIIEIKVSIGVIRKRDFESLKSVKEVMFSSGNDLIKIEGFQDCTSLYRIEIPSSVKVIGPYGFTGCTSLTKICFSSDSRLRKILGFERCTSLCRIDIPSSVEIIGYCSLRVSGFWGCTSLNDIRFSSDSHLRDIDGFGECTSLCRIEIPSSVEVFPWYGFSGCTSLRTVVIRAGCRIKVNEGLRRIKPFLVYPEDDMKEGRNLIRLGFGRR
jgi:hypothetical protein